MFSELVMLIISISLIVLGGILVNENRSYGSQSQKLSSWIVLALGGSLLVFYLRDMYMKGEIPFLKP